MASKKDIKDKRKEVLKEIKSRLDKNHNIGIDEFVADIVRSKGIEIEGDSHKAIGEAVKRLRGKDKKELVASLEVYKKSHDKAINDFDKGLHRGITQLPKKAIATISKGAGIGLGAAGAVNTLLPNLFNTTLGFIAGAGAAKQSTYGTLATFFAGAAAPPRISAGVILAVGAAAGAVTYTAGKVVVKGIKAIYNKIKTRKSDQMER